MSAIYFEGEFWSLVVTALLLPGGIFSWLIRKRRVSWKVATVLSIILIVLGGIVAVLLQMLATRVKATPEIGDDMIFASEFSIALYILPLLLAGIGMNLLTRVLNDHVIFVELADERKGIVGPQHQDTKPGHHP
jgi:hypothetical protein